LELIMMGPAAVGASAEMIGGTVKDSLGALVQNAKVELIETTTGKVVKSTTTDEKGSYSLSVTEAAREPWSWTCFVSIRRRAGDCSNGHGHAHAEAADRCVNLRD
jgi:hypothetical protein